MTSSTPIEAAGQHGCNRDPRCLGGQRFAGRFEVADQALLAVQGSSENQGEDLGCDPGLPRVRVGPNTCNHDDDRRRDRSDDHRAKRGSEMPCGVQGHVDDQEVRHLEMALVTDRQRGRGENPDRKHLRRTRGRRLRATDTTPAILSSTRSPKDPGSLICPATITETVAGPITDRSLLGAFHRSRMTPETRSPIDRDRQDLRAREDIVSHLRDTVVS